ncbi:MAG: CaiB/BaiF CoA-transferase family protein [Candidatus Binatia bacterium]|nr:CaiB/BaiF CoA-transferase family protein [Candidatus Binatia bacterium]
MADGSGAGAPLAGVRVIESALLGPGGVAMHLADLGAEVIKVEPPGGDYVRKMAFPIVDGISILHWHLNRGKQSLTLDLRKPEGVDVYLDLVRGADAVVEGMRPGALERRGLGWDRLRETNPALVYCAISGYGLTGPYRDMPSHGIAYDAWAGVARPGTREDGLPEIPAYTTIGIHAGPLFAAFGIVSAILRARATGEGSRFEVAQSDAAAAFNWNGIEGNKAYERPAAEVTGNDGDGRGPRRPLGENSMKDAVRYQYYPSKDGTVLFMASEREFWKNFAHGVGKPELYARRPGAKFGDHARGDLELRRELAAIFETRTTREWVEFGREFNTPIAPVNDTTSIAQDPQFQHRLGFDGHAERGTDLMPTPLKFPDETLPVLAKAAVEPGRDNERVLRDVLGYDDEKVEALEKAGVLGTLRPVS